MLLLMVGVVLRGAQLPTLSMYSVFDRPPDFPDRVVVRRFDLWVVPGEALAGPIVAIGATVEEVREQLPAGLTRLPRSPGDVASLVETWI